MGARGPLRRRVLLTGATGAIGSAIAAGLCRERENQVILGCRDERRAQALLAELRRTTKSEHISFELVDLASKSSIYRLAARLPERLDLLVNNAAVAPRRREQTAAGIEQVFATNVLGYFWMIDAFTPQLAAAAPSQVINVASYWAGDLALQDLEFRQRRYDNDTAYRQSKQANRMLTSVFAERLRPRGIRVNACHPGDVNSALSRSLGYGGHESPEAGAATPLWLAVQDPAREVTGCYFEHQQEVPCRFMADRAAAQALYERCASY